MIRNLHMSTGLRVVLFALLAAVLIILAMLSTSFAGQWPAAA